MNKTELINAVATASGLSKTDARKTVEAFTEVVTDAPKEGMKVTVIGFGTFCTTRKSARTGINPLTEAPIRIAAKRTVRFKAGTGLAEALKTAS